MKVVAHISDAHFGAHDPTIAAGLLTELNSIRPAVVAFSGDFTQRARTAQFQAASMWLEQLTVPYVAVPGNHDIPLYDVVRRFTSPRERYRMHICDDLEPCYFDGEVAVCGIDTTDTHKRSRGTVTRAQAERVAAKLAAHASWRVVVAHHPIVAPSDSDEAAEGAAEAIRIFEDARLDLVLTGHLHVPHVGGRNEAHTIIGVQAGTCISTRLRGSANGYNQLRLSGEHVTIVHRTWDGGRFVDGEYKMYERRDGGERLVKVATS